MSLNYGLAAKRAEYARNAVLSATPARLLTMLYDRLLLDLSRAEAAQQAGNWQVASEQLIHAQAIIAELSGSLKVQDWEGGASRGAVARGGPATEIHSLNHRHKKADVRGRLFQQQ